MFNHFGIKLQYFFLRFLWCINIKHILHIQTNREEHDKKLEYIFNAKH